MTKLLRYVKPYTKMAIFSLALTFSGVFCNLFLPNFMSLIINNGVMQKDLPYVLRTGIFMLLVALAGIAVNILSGYFASQTSMRFGRDLRSAVFRKVENFSLAEFDHFSTSSLITRTTNDIQNVQMVIFMSLRIAAMSPLMAIGGIIMAYHKNAQLSNVIFVSMPLLIAVVYLANRFIVPLTKTMQKRIDRMNQVMREKLTGIRVMRAFGTEDFEEQRFDMANKDLTGTSLKMFRIMSVMMPLLTLVLNGTAIFIVWRGGPMVASSGILVGDLMALIEYVNMIMGSLMMLSMIFVMLPRALTSAGRINEVLDTVPAITDPKNPVELTNPKGIVTFNDVSFTYQGASGPALSDISFTARPGQTTAIIGSTGSGKTTLVNMILRLYEVTKGAVTVDGVPLPNFRQADLRSIIGFAPQKPVLFSGTISDNLRDGNPNATDKQLEEAAAIAQALDFIGEKEEGFQTHLAQGATNLSGGQKQRLSIARAIVRRPKIYIFDDCFSALDFKTDSRLRGELAGITGDATVIIVAQRVSTIMNADQIIVLDAGKIVGIGTHRQLCQNCGIYNEIVSSQLSPKEAAV